MNLSRRRSAYLLSLLLLIPVLPAHGADPAEGPPIRIRLTTGEDDATVSCAGGLRVLDIASGRSLGPVPFGARAIFVAEHKGGRPKAVFRAQVVSLTSEQEARELAADLGRRLDVPYRVHYHADRRAWRVRLGAGKTAASLDDLVRRLAALGYDQVWVTEDVPEAERGSLRVVDARWNDYPSRPALRVVPAKGCDRLTVGERTYRGLLEVRLDRQGRLAVINQLPLEEYLRGVVPNELGPAQYPEVEALKAQAVAARTYAWRNLGQFGEDGYDLCDTPRCQVYKGAGTEHPLTDRAIRETAGVVLTRGGEAIHALYSSTCGGHTEEGSLIFPEETGAYLKPVACYAGGAAGRRSRWALSGRTPAPALAEAGGSLGRDLYLLEALGVLDPKGWARGDLGRPVPDGEAAKWIDAALEVVGKKGDAGAAGVVTSRDELVRELVRRLGWEERGGFLVAPADLDYLLDFADATSIPRKHRADWALLLKDGLVTPFADGTLRPAAPPARGELAETLARLIRHYGAEGLTSGSVRGVVGDAVRVEVRGEERVVGLPEDARLVKMLRDQGYPVARMQVLAGDGIRFRSHEDAEGHGILDFAEVSPSPRSASDDRFTRVYEWQVRLERGEVEGRLAERVRGIGELRDLEVLERGKSGRVLRLRVVGTEGQPVLVGFPIRTALGLRDTSFTIDRQRGADGRVTAFLFSGKGWGHGVGMCQVGAYGMALRGAQFGDILGHYYTGITLDRAYP